MKPRLPAELEAHDLTPTPEGILFVGDRGSILAGFQGQNPRLFVQGENRALRLDAGSTDGIRAARGERSSPWVAACQGGKRRPGNFVNAAAITDAVNLGTVALRAGRKVLFDSAAMRITNVPEANRYLVREYRPGWELTEA
jgi:hypothetical protein